MAALNCQRQGDCSYYNGQRKQNNVYNNIPHNGQRGGIYNDISRLNLWCWLINHGVSRDEIHRKPTAYLFDLYKQKNPQTNNRKAALDHGKRQPQPVNPFTDLSQFTDAEPIE